jgi:hypothetical protein
MGAKTTIVVNGVEYPSVHDMPPEIRAQFERVAALVADRDRNGIPDVIERPSALAEALEHLRVAGNHPIAAPATHATATLRLPVEDRSKSMLAPLLLGLLGALLAVVALGIVPAPRF